MSMTTGHRVRIGALVVAVLISGGFAAGQAQQVRKPAAQSQKPRPAQGSVVARQPSKSLPFIPARVETPIFLEVQQGSKEFESWVTSLPLDVPMSLLFRWRTENSEVRLAHWEVSTSPFPPSGVPYAWTVPIIASGFAGQAPDKGHVQTFRVDFPKFLPTPPPASPTRYYVRIVPSRGLVRPVAAAVSVPKRRPDPQRTAAAASAGASGASAAEGQSEFSGVSSVPIVVTYVRPSTEQTTFTDLPPSPYEVDWDRDGLPDLAEFYIAEKFKPYFVFDSDEGNRRANEPVMVFQVRPDGCVGPKCPGPVRALIKYYMLFAEDGGYGPSSDCKDRHNGDDQGLDMVVESPDRDPYGSSWRLLEITNGDYKWPGWSVAFWADVIRRQTHPVIYLSAHKHHQYFDTSNDEKDSKYSDYGCNDDVNGRGVVVFANLLTPQNRPANVGEPEAHAADYFINDLGVVGYKNECAWCGKPFKGGLGDDGGNTDPLVWNKGAFQIRR